MLRTHWLALPKLIRFLVTHFAEGVVFGWACGLVVIWLDLGGIGSLLATGENGLMTALFFAQGGLWFGTVHMGVAVMNLRDKG